MGAETDELFQPSLASYVAPAEQPWRLDSQFWVAFFGGTLAGGAIGYVNAGRLRLPPTQRIAILWIVSAALALEVAAAYVLAVADIAAAIGDGIGRVLILTVQGAGAVAYPCLHRVQRSGDRIFRLGHAKADYASLWRPGLAAVVLGGPIGIAFTWAAVNLVER